MKSHEQKPIPVCKKSAELHVYELVLPDHVKYKYDP